MTTRRRAGLLSAFALALIWAAPLPAQEMAPIPAPIMSDEAAATLDQALSGVTHEDFSLSFRSYYFPSLQGGTLTMVGFELGKAGLTFGVDDSAATDAAAAMAPVELARLELFGVLMQGDAEIARFGDEFTLAPGNGNGETSAVHSFGDTVATGTYDLVWGVRDTFSGNAASRRDTLEIPALASAGLGTSSVLMVAGQPMPASGMFAPYEVHEGVRVLTVAFPDDLDRVLAADTASIMLTYIVVGARPDSATMAFNIEISYSIVDSEGESLWRVAPQALNRPTVGQEIPFGEIENLEVGTPYAFEILVKDLAAGTESTTRVPFQIAG